ncbi:uncharacterized protein LOC143284198 [Babylonia areolata]|uniref:uncharacterized protein LOC143284198 n=1 Tax=Babylonia areolata TaxID=304850 RepID=UPI003FD47E29
MKGSVICLFLGVFHFAVSQTQNQTDGLAGTLQNMITSMESGEETDTDNPLLSLAPTTPSPESINCFVALPAVRVGGQCVRLGRMIRRVRGRSRNRGRRRNNRRRSSVAWGCQAGMHLDIGSPECNNNNNNNNNAIRRSSQRQG